MFLVESSVVLKHVTEFEVSSGFGSLYTVSAGLYENGEVRKIAWSPASGVAVKPEGRDG